MDKVKLPKEVAEALDDLKHHFCRWEWNVMLGIFDEQAIARESVAVLRKFAEFHNNIILILKALVNGYEIEQTPEDKVRELYNHWNDWMGNDGHYSSQTIASTIVDVLNALNIKIPGVNDNA